jgi:hypothetical protein
MTWMQFDVRTSNPAEGEFRIAVCVIPTVSVSMSSAPRQPKLLYESTQLLLANFDNHLNRFASHIHGGILGDFKFCYQFTTFSKGSAIDAAINNLLEPGLRHCSSSIHNDSMGTPSAEVVRKFNLKYNKKSGENQIR